MLRKKFTAIVLGLMVVSSILSACGGADTQSGETADKKTPGTTGNVQVSKDPVSLTMLQFGSPLSDEEFKEMISDPVKAKYPNISVEIIRFGPGDTLETLITSGRTPDLIYSGILNVADALRVELPVDINPLIRKFNYNTSAIQPTAMDMVKKYSDEGKVYAMPLSLTFPVMIYNKDIFDLLGVSYPKDWMTWEETTELSKKVLAKNSGTQFKAFGTVAFQRLSLTMLLNRFDPKTEKATITSDKWKEGLETYRTIMTLPGNLDKLNNAWARFSKDRTLAMYAGFNAEMNSLDQFRGVDAFNWDMTTFPTFDSSKKMVDTPLGIMMISTKDTKKQDAAFQVITSIISPENQLAMSKMARPTVLKDAAIQKAFGQDIPTLKGKNIGFISEYKYQPVNRRSLFDKFINPELNKAADRVIGEGQDINTALRIAEEAANKAIEADKK
jgi:multiple sugar transport system substrate-binding protein